MNTVIAQIEFDFDEPPILLESVAPTYSEDAKLKGCEGTVKVLVYLNSEGLVDSVTLAQYADSSLTVPGICQELKDAALEAARIFKFKPAQKDNEVVPSLAMIPFNFVLGSSKSDQGLRFSESIVPPKDTDEALALGVCRAAVEALSSLNFDDYASLLHADAVSQMAELADIFSELEVEAEDLNEDPDAAYIGKLNRAVKHGDPDERRKCAIFLELTLSISPAMLDIYRSMTYEPIGALRESEDLIHVVMRLNMTAMDVEISTLEVMPCHRINGQWFISLTSDIEKMLNGFRNMLPE